MGRPRRRRDLDGADKQLTEAEACIGLTESVEILNAHARGCAGQRKREGGGGGGRWQLEVTPASSKWTVGAESACILISFYHGAVDARP